MISDIEFNLSSILEQVIVFGVLGYVNCSDIFNCQKRVHLLDEELQKDIAICYSS